MAKELRKSRGEELFAVAVREVFDAVAELRTDQSTEWTEELKESLMEFADIIAEPTDLPPEREFDFEINLESDDPPQGTNMLLDLQWELCCCKIKAQDFDLSRTMHARMNKHEVHYPVHEQELLAVRDALIKFRCYLDGAAGFTVITDHAQLRHFFRHAICRRGKYDGWQVFAPYQRHMDIVYKRGAANHADALSRRPDLKDALQKLDLLNKLVRRRG
eukprot:jgi/Tetstr1/440097/TSEL_028455.t1